MRSDETNEVVIQLENDGIDEELTGIREGRYVRLPRSIAERFSSIKNLIDERGGTLNNIWGILETETGEPLTNGQKLYARVRIKLESGGFVIAAATVALGVVVAVTVVQQSHKKR
ncbi:hypothetical protein D3C85_331600 [compost metagenome]|jgi:hypothetical protein